MPTHRTPENPRWTRSADKIAVLYELRGLWLDLGLRCRAVEPVPADWEHYFEDLRRNRLDVGPAMARFFDTIERRGLGYEGRQIGTRAIALLQRYLDLCVPPDVAETPRPVLMPSTHVSGRVRAMLPRQRTGTDA